MPAHSRSWGFRGGLPPGVFTNRSAIYKPSADTRATEGSERAIFLMSAGLCWVTICWGFLAGWLSVAECTIIVHAGNKGACACLT
jgi:hypothetical protein